MKHINKIYYIILFILSFIIIGGASILTADIGFNLLKDPTFYLIQLLTYVAIILVTLGTVYSVIDTFKEKNVEYNAASKFISDFAMDGRNIPSFMAKFLEGLNKKRKINQYKYNLRKKLYYLNSYRPWYWYILPWRWGKKKFTDKDIHIWNYGTIEEKQANKYCQLRSYLEEQLSDSFIEKNIDNTHVRYKRITESVILGGYYADINKKGPNEFIETNLTRRILRNKMPKLMLSFGFTFIMSSVVFDSLMFNAGAIMPICIKLITLLWNAYLAVRYGKQLCDTVILKDIRFRKGIVTEYDKWIIQQAEAKEQSKTETFTEISKKKEEITPMDKIQEILNIKKGGDNYAGEIK